MIRIEFWFPISNDERRLVALLPVVPRVLDFVEFLPDDKAWEVTAVTWKVQPGSNDATAHVTLDEPRGH